MSPALPELTLPTLSEAEQELLTYFPPNFPVNNSKPFGVLRTFTLLAAQSGLDAQAFMASLVPQGFPLLATGFWLDEHMASVAEERIKASFAAGNVKVTSAANSTLPAGDLLQTEPDVFGERLLFVVTQDTPLVVGVNTVSVRASQAGAKYNVGAGRITSLVTVNPVVTGVTNTADWLTSAGVDEESDDLLRERYLLAWTGISTGGSWRSYVRWAREVPGIIKVKVLDDHPRGQGTVDVVVAPPAGLPTPEQIAAVNSIVQDNRPVTADVLVRGPDLAPQNFAFTLYKKPTSNTTNTQWQARIQAVIDQQGIGDAFYSSSVVDALMATGELFGVVPTSTDYITVDPDTLITAGSIAVTVV
ncbi:baseplate J/gp47 family protein [Deinococcus misasensis]|uniref:baseplate J/gp47 family protein n=1 Tax=Deinococcus misasensis TaxID=392413 RepID=UPI00068C1996|nr:baseplate J/gp47 family protein [Deinococcus misasensis]